MPDRPICAILDDYQNAAFASADWSVLDGRVTLRRYETHLGDEDSVADALADCAVIVAMRERTVFSESLLRRLPKLKLLITTGMRNRSIDLVAAHALNIVVCGTGSERGSVAELGWGALIAFMRNIPEEMANFREGGPWQIGLGRTLEGRRLGVVGLGRQGRRIARFGQAFRMDVCGWTRTDQASRCETLGIEAVSLDVLFQTSDVVCIQLALTENTRGFVTAKMLSQMRPDAVFMNTARGPLVDEPALIKALQDKRIGGAVLDVFEQEPLAVDHPFRTLSNVLATPHIGYVTQENYRAYYRDVVDDIAGWLDGNPPRRLT